MTALKTDWQWTRIDREKEIRKWVGRVEREKERKTERKKERNKKVSR